MRTICIQAGLLLAVVATELHFDDAPACIKESLLVLSGTGVLYVVGLRVMVGRMKEQMRGDAVEVEDYGRSVAGGD